MRVGLFTDAFSDRPLAAALDWLERELPEVRDLEVGTGGYSPAPHCDRELLLRDAAVRGEWLAAFGERGLRLAALNVSGNPLADPAHDAALRETLELARLLSVDRVVCMSGGDPRLAGAAWFPGLEEESERFFAERVEPYWRDVVRAAGEVRLCFELEPGSAAYNTSTFERLAAVSPAIALNVDPSHFFWQGIDPLAVVRRARGRIGWAHGKDTVLYPERIALDGFLDRDAWRYAVVGGERAAPWWRSFARALAEAAYDDVIAIEVEDATMTSEEAVLRSALVLLEALEEHATR